MKLRPAVLMGPIISMASRMKTFLVAGQSISASFCLQLWQLLLLIERLMLKGTTVQVCL